MHSHSFASRLASSRKVYSDVVLHLKGAVLANLRSIQAPSSVSSRRPYSIPLLHKLPRFSLPKRAFSTRIDLQTSKTPDGAIEHVADLLRRHPLHSRTKSHITTDKQSRRKRYLEYTRFETLLPREKIKGSHRYSARNLPSRGFKAEAVARTRGSIALRKRSEMAQAMPVTTPGARQKFQFQFVTTPTSDTPGTTLLLHFDNKRYFFGHIAEGTQRACIQQGVGIKKVRNMFLTSPVTWNSMGGLLGMILTMADVQLDEIDPTTGKRPVIEIHGGPKLLHTVACARRFTFRTGMPISICEEDRKGPKIFEPTYADQNISVWSIPVESRGRVLFHSSTLPANRSKSPGTVDSEQRFRAEVVKNMFDSDWRKDRLVESRFDEVKLPALIWTRNPDTKDLDHFQCATMADAPHLSPDSRVFVRNAWPASLVEELPPVDNLEGSLAISYIVKGRPQRGKFLPQKAKEIGVKPGPSYAQLAAGESVTLEDGTIVTPDMVLDKTEPGKGMAILDVPADEYIEDLAEKLKTLIGDVMDGIGTVSWLLGKGVIFNPGFTSMVNSLSGLQHIISSPDACPDYLALTSAAASSTRLAQILPKNFKVPIHSNENSMPQTSPQNFQYTPAEPGLIVQAAPKLTINKKEVAAYIDIEKTKSVYPGILNDLMPTEMPSNESGRLYDDVEIITLGTGSAVPSKYRNVSATLVRVPGLGSYLFDCGENTLGSLRRVYTDAELDKVLADLRMIWISHLHADHHLGTISVIEAKQKVMQRLENTEPKLHLISEPNMADYLNDYNSVQSSSGCELFGVVNSQLFTKNASSPSSQIEISQTSLPIKEFLTTKVSHCHGAQACSITFDNGFKFSYSGDCRPSAQFAKIGQNSDVLLHEATFDDGLEGDAMAKKHSTTAEALAVAYAMKAKNVVLTHFSQRYQKIPALNNVKFSEVKFEEVNETDDQGPMEEHMSYGMSDEAPGESTKSDAATQWSNTKDSVAALQEVARNMSVCVAFDLMSVTVGQIRDMYKYYPAIEKMFELEQEKSDAKKDERREAGEKMKEEKAKKDGKWKATASIPKKPAEVKNGDLYQKINRNKVKKSSNTNSSVAHASADASDRDNNTGENGSPGTGSRSPLSNRARQRQAREAKKQQWKHEAPDTNHKDLLQPRVEEDIHKPTRQLSAEPETSESKRIKLTDEHTV